MNKVIESGWWNGLPAKITCCIIEVIAYPEKPMFWFNAFAGQTRQVVEITQDGTSFIIDNEHGDGFHKVTAGQGSPGCGSKHYDHGFKLVDYVAPDYWNRIYDTTSLRGEQVVVEDYQKRTCPEEFEKMKSIENSMKEFLAMSPQEKTDHIRNNMMPGSNPQPRPSYPAGGPRKFTSPNKQQHSVHKKDGKGKR